MPNCSAVSRWRRVRAKRWRCVRRARACPVCACAAAWTIADRARRPRRSPAAQADLQGAEAAIALTRHRLAVSLGRGPDRGRASRRPRSSPMRWVFRPMPVSIWSGAARCRRRARRAPKRRRSGSRSPRRFLSQHQPRRDRRAAVARPVQTVRQRIGLWQCRPRLQPADLRWRADRRAISRQPRRFRSVGGQLRPHFARGLGQAADAVATLDSTEAQLAEQRRSVAANGDAARIARLRYTGGLSNQLVQLTAEDWLVASDARSPISKAAGCLRRSR